MRLALRSLARFSADLHTMPYLQLDGQRITLEIGEVTIGSAQEAGVKVPGAGEATAIVRVGPDLQSSVRRSGDSTVRVNGVQLGAEPTPLIHGDKIEVGGAELFFGDDRMAGSTQYISAANLPQRPNAGPARAPRRTQASGGRLLSLVDGREYAIPGGGLVIGRDASCDVVVPTSEVSRRHAEIAPSNEGYVLKDTSTNGVFVNGERVSVTQTLGRGDIVRVGNEDFRFYADLVVAATPPDVTPTPAEPAAAAEAARAAAAIRASTREPPASEAQSAPVSGAGAPTPIVAPRSITTPPASGRPLLAMLEVVSTGVLKGQRFEVRSPLAHVGRGAHNDVVLPDESVSDAHAKLQKREAGWYVVDMGSTNGTYVGGRRVETEYKLEGAPDLRFGGVKVTFRPGAAENVVEDVKGTRAFSMPRGARAAQGTPPQSTKPSAPVVAPGAEDPEAPTKGPGFPLWLWLAVVMLVLLGAFFIYEQSR
ncbi:MAG TPA: FHA domain-containing protein [Gemmatimonadaceae bacterium]|nr:FHA domain-containing protein [Gemmatimonadaceae bacterium]